MPNRRTVVLARIAIGIPENMQSAYKTNALNAAYRCGMRHRGILVKERFAACFLVAAVLLGSVAGAQTGPDASMLAPVRAWIDAYNAGRPLPETIFTSDVLVTDEFPPYVWSGAAAEHQWAQAIDAFIKPGQQHVSVGAAQAFTNEANSVSFVLPAVLTISVAPHPARTEHAFWKFTLVRSGNQWLIASDTWIGDAASGAAVSVPMRSVRGIELVQGTFDGTGPFWFMLDPGGADSYSSYARTYVPGHAPKALCIDGRCVHPQLTLVDDFSAGPDIGGTIGPSIFQKYVVRLDYADSMVTLIPPRIFRPPSGEEALPLTFDRYGMPVVPASVNGMAGLFQLDVRVPSSLLFRPFMARTGLEKDGRVDVLDLGGVAIKDPPFRVSSATSGKFADPVEAGLLGNKVLSHFVVTLDVPHQRVFISRRA